MGESTHHTNGGGEIGGSTGLPADRRREGFADPAMPSFRRFHGINLGAQYYLGPHRHTWGRIGILGAASAGRSRDQRRRSRPREKPCGSDGGRGCGEGTPDRGMANAHLNAGLAALYRVWAGLHLHWRAIGARAARRGRLKGKHGRKAAAFAPRSPRSRRRPRMRRLAIGAGVATGLAGIAAGALWWRLGSGPLSVDIVTPWLTAAVEERLGGGHRIEVGGTQLERTEDGRAALRLRDIVVRDPDGTVVASAPKAEVGISSLGLLTGHLQAKRLSLIGAAMAVRVERDGQLTIFAGADKRPIAKAPVVATAGDILPKGAAV